MTTGGSAPYSGDRQKAAPSAADANTPINGFDHRTVGKDIAGSSRNNVNSGFDPASPDAAQMPYRVSGSLGEKSQALQYMRPARRALNFILASYIRTHVAKVRHFQG